MEATCWSDYLCPWCYVGQQRDGLFAELGVADRLGLGDDDDSEVGPTS